MSTPDGAPSARGTDSVRSIHERPVPANVSAARKRAAAAFAAMCLGLWLGHNALTPGVTWSFAISLALAATAFALRGIWLRIALTLAMVSFGMGWYTLRIERPSPDSLSIVLATTADSAQGPSPARTMASVEGIVLDAPQSLEQHASGLDRFLDRGPRSGFTLETRSLIGPIGLVPASGSLRIYLDAPPPTTIHAGDAIRLTGLFARPQPPDNPGAPDRRLIAAQDGVEGSLSLPSATLITPLPSPPWWNAADTVRSTFASIRSSLRARAQRAVDAMLGDAHDDSAALVRGLLLGRLGREGADVQATFTRLGMLHALTISGFHLAVMALVTLTLVRLTGDRGWLEPTIVAALVLAYSLIVPPNSPVLRSALMVILLLASEAFGRRYDRLTLLLWIAVLILLIRPLDLWALGFQLTFGLTALLYTVVPVFQSRTVGPRVFGTKPGTTGAHHRLARLIKEAFAINFSCWLVSAPAILLRTGLLSPVAVLAGMIVGPLVVLVLWCGYVALLLGMFEPSLAGWLGVRHVARWTTWAATSLDSAPWGSFRLPPVSLAWAAVGTLALVGWLGRGWWRRARGAAVLGVLGVWLAAEWAGAGLGREVALRVDMLGVQDGSCLLVRSGKDAILWDAGSLTAGLGTREVPTALRSLGAWRVPTVVITHPDLDHYGLLPDLIGPLGVRNVVVGERFLERAAQAPRGPEAFLLETLAQRRVRVDVVHEGARMALGDRIIEFISPGEHAPYGRDNEHSLVARITGPATDAVADAVLTGDVSSQAVDDLLVAWPTLRAKVMELPHHGSADARAIEWVGKVSPEVMLQSTGPKRVDDPRWSIVRSGRAWRCTAVEGAVWAEITSDGSVRSGAMQRSIAAGRALAK